MGIVPDKLSTAATKVLLLIQIISNFKEVLHLSEFYIYSYPVYTSKPKSKAIHEKQR